MADKFETECVVTKIIFNRGSFYIFAVEDDFTVKGNSTFQIVPGGQYKISGVVSEYNGQMQIVADKIEESEDLDRDTLFVAEFLKEYVTGIGEKSALKLSDKYGREVLDKFISDKEEIIKGKLITKTNYAKAKKIIDNKLEEFKIKLEFKLLGLTRTVIDRAVDVEKLEYDDIMQNPFVLMEIPGVGFELCENLFGKTDIDEYFVPRFKGAIINKLFEMHVNTGNTYFFYQEINDAVYKFLNLSNLDDEKYVKTFLQAFDELRDEKKVVSYLFVDKRTVSVSINTTDARIALTKYTKKEIDIKKQILSFLDAKMIKFDEKKAKKRMRVLAQSQNIELDDKQMEALLLCLSKPFSIITGGPGTGKTTIMSLLYKHFSRENIKCVFCAPTGRAAKRLEDVVGKRANTIHRLLGINKTDDDSDVVFTSKDANNPIDARVIIVDEVSMVDTEIFALLLNAIESGSSVILIGDPNQLPSVGPGNILTDLLRFDRIPRVELTCVFRQTDNSQIAMNAYKILEKNESLDEGDDFKIYNFTNENEALNFISDTYYDCYVKKEDMVILTPTKQKTLGTINLNKIIQERITGDNTSEFIARGSLVFRAGDSIMQIKNDYKIEHNKASDNDTKGHGVYNGELGVIDFLSEDGANVVFDDGKEVMYDKAGLANIDLAYAMTVHKAQGCEFDSVILVLGNMNYLLSNSNILYTAVTRAKKKLIVVNCNERLNKMINSQIDKSRNTSLYDFLCTINGRKNGN